MRLRALKCKYCFPDIVKGELTATCITQRFEYQFSLRWETSSLERNLFQGASASVASWVWCDLALEGRGIVLTLWLCPVWQFDAKVATGRVDILWVWGWLPVLVRRTDQNSTGQFSTFTFLWWRGEQAIYWDLFPFFLPSLCSVLPAGSSCSLGLVKLGVLLQKWNWTTTFWPEICLKIELRITRDCTPPLLGGSSSAAKVWGSQVSDGSCLPDTSGCNSGASRAESHARSCNNSYPLRVGGKRTWNSGACTSHTWFSAPNFGPHASLGVLHEN